jgi:hypothetical protein
MKQNPEPTMQAMISRAELQVAIQTVAGYRTFGGNKVWIVDVARELALSVSDLVPVLMHLQRLGQVSLSRCDLVQLAPEGVVEASEIRNAWGGEWHLVRVH